MKRATNKGSKNQIEKSSSNPKKKIKHNQGKQLEGLKLLPQTDLITESSEIKKLTKRKMKRLYTPYLPQCAKFFKCHDQSDTVFISTVKLNLQKNPTKHWHFNQIQNLKANRISAQDNSQGYLAIFQTLAFCALNIEAFSQIFYTEKERLQNYQEIKRSFQLFQIPNKKYFLWPVVLLEPLNFESQQFQKLFQKEIIQALQEKVDIQPSQLIKLQKIQSDNQSIMNLKQQEDASQRQKSEANKSKINSFREKSEYSISPQNIVSKSQFNINIQFPDLQDCEFSEQNIQQKSLQEDEKNQFFNVWFIGSTKYQKISQEKIISWQSLSDEALQYIFTKTRFQILYDQIKMYIKSINKFLSFTQVDLKPNQVKNFLKRVVKVKEQLNSDKSINILKQSTKQKPKSKKEIIKKSEKKLGIALRYKNDITLGKRNVLVKFLQDGSRQWVPIQKLQVNYTAPKLFDQQLIILYLTSQVNKDKNIQVEQLLEHLYKDFLYEKNDIKNFFMKALELNLFSNPKSLRQVQIQKKKKLENDQTFKKCQACGFAIYDIPFKKCQFCSEFCHKQCIVQIQHSWANQEWKPWLCPKCQTCRTCFGVINQKQNRLQCKNCLQIFHSQCGKIKVFDNQESPDQQKFVCQNCLRCLMCKQKLKDKSFQQFQGDFYCSKCSIRRQKGDFCHVCKNFQQQKVKGKQTTTKWIQCSQQACKRWIHQQCDPIIFSHKNCPIPQVYFCTFCRKEIRRKILIAIINMIKPFDQCQFFTDPTYQKFPDYKNIVSHPMCLSIMIKKSTQGQYDTNPRQLLIKDFNLIVENALLYNMPKQNANYRARTLNIMAQQVFKKFDRYFDFPQSQLHKDQIFQTIRDQQISFFKFVYDSYPQLLLNYKANKSKIQVVRKPTKDPLHYKFNSQHLLKQVFKYSSINFILEKTPNKIQDLFTVDKLDKSVWSNVNGIQCYYHPGQKAKYVCDICCESYCCLEYCKNHQACPRCGNFGCDCLKYGCMCKPHSQQVQKKAKKRFQTLNNPEHQITQNNRYCFVCCKDPKNKQCYFCNQLVFEFYQRCNICNILYHLNCDKNRNDIKFYKYSLSKVDGYCLKCAYQYQSQQNMNATQQCLTLKVKQKIIKYEKVNRYLDLTLTIYKYAGVRIHVPQILKMLINNFDQFSSRQTFFNEFQNNREIVSKNHKSSRRILAMERQITQKRLVNYTNFQIQNIVNPKLKIDQTIEQAFSKFHDFCDQIQGCTILNKKQKQDLKKLQQFLQNSLSWQYYEDFKMANQFKNTQQYHKYYKKITQKIKTIIHPDIVPIQEIGFISEKLLITTKLFQSEFNYLKPLSKRFQYQILKIRIVLRRQFLYERQIQLLKYKINLKFPTFFQKQQKVNFSHHIIQHSFPSFFTSEKMNHTEEKYERDQLVIKVKTKSKQPQQIIRRDYFGYVLYNQQKQRDYVTSLVSSSILLKQQQSFIIPTFLLSTDSPPHRSLQGKRLSYYQRTQMKCWKQLQSFLMKIYQQNRRCLRKGSTCVVKSDSNQHRVLKKWKINQKFIDIKLWKKTQHPRSKQSYNQDFVQNQQKDTNHQRSKQQQIKTVWCMTIDQYYFQIETINDILEAIYKKMGVKIYRFNQLAKFLGFTLRDPYFVANHYTQFLQTNQIDKIPIPQLIDKVQQVIKDFQWEQGGVYKKVTHQIDGSVVQKKFNMTKKPIFYLQKRNKKQLPRKIEEIPYITYEDLQHDLNPKHLLVGVAQGKTNVLSSSQLQSFQKRDPNQFTFIAPSKIHKLGLFARKDLRKNTVVIEYMGQIISQPLADRRQTQFHLGCYMFGLNRKNHDKKDIIDATFRGNMARYLNHSCDPNCKATIQNIDNNPRILIYTMRDIKRYQQLTYDYQFRVQNTNQKLACMCGAKNCQGRLN